MSTRAFSLRAPPCLTPAPDLTVHHTIEERHIFPNLAKRMPSFKEDEQHIKSHHGIHEGRSALPPFSSTSLCAHVRARRAGQARGAARQVARGPVGVLA